MRRIGRYLGNNLLGLVALTVAISGTAYAAATVGSAQIVDNSVKSVDILNNGVKGTDLLDESVTGFDIKDGSVQEADIAQGPWRAVEAFTTTGNCATSPAQTGTFCKSGNVFWTNYGDPYQAARYRRGATGEVVVEGLVANTGPSASTQGVPVFVLPEGYRPAARLMFTAACGSAGGDLVGAVEVQADGSVYFRDEWSDCTATDFVSLSGISFSTS